MHRQSPTTIIDTAVARPATTSRTALRAGSTPLLGGLVAEYVVTSFHAAHENPNDHHAVFAEYAASDNWIAVHLGQFAAGLVVIAGIITLLRALRPTTGPALFTRVAEGAAILTASMIAVLKGIDGFTLKHAVDSLAASPPAMHDAAFHDAEIVRWMEWAAAGYFRITLGLIVALLSVAVLRSRALPRWSAPLVLLAGLALSPTASRSAPTVSPAACPTWWPGRHSSSSPSSRQSPPGGVAGPTGPPSTNHPRIGFSVADLTGNALGPSLATRPRDRLLPGGLTDREAEVLGCLATGRSNKEVAAALVISDKTVQRHLPTSLPSSA